MKQPDGITIFEGTEMKCCDKQMEYFESPGMGILEDSVNESRIWICNVCGAYVKLEDGKLTSDEIMEIRIGCGGEE